MKIVVINSNGPMGSSVVGAIVEKFGYLNAPVRNLGLNRCLLSGSNTDMGSFKQSFLKTYVFQSRKVKLGGVSMVDRDTGPSLAVIDDSRIEQEIATIKQKEFDNIAELYETLRDAYAKAIIYKKIHFENGKHIEYTTYFDKYPTIKLYDAYIAEFGEVCFIHMHRDFVGWVESVMSQYFSGNRRWRIILLHALRSRYLEYEAKTKNCPGLHLDFESLFTSEKKQVFNKIASSLGESASGIDWESESYDLYGKLKDYSSTFTLADAEGTYLSSGTRWFVRYCLRKRRITRIHDLVFYLFCLVDVSRFLIRKKDGNKPKIIS